MRSRLIASALAGVALFPASGAGVGSGLVRLPKHVLSPQAMSRAKHLGRKASSDRVTLAVSLQVNDPAALARAVESVSDPSSPSYGHYVTPEQFAARFSPSQSDFAQALEYLNVRGTTATETHSNRLVIDVEGSTDQVEQAFGLELHEYLLPDGRVAHAPSAEPLMSDALANRVNGILGLNNFSKRVTHVHRPSATPFQVGTGPGGGLIPADLRKVYNLNGLAQTG